MEFGGHFESDEKVMKISRTHPARDAIVFAPVARLFLAAGWLGLV